jgi:hypothetical protein
MYKTTKSGKRDKRSGPAKTAKQAAANCRRKGKRS